MFNGPENSSRYPVLELPRVYTVFTVHSLFSVMDMMYAIRSQMVNKIF